MPTALRRVSKAEIIGSLQEANRLNGPVDPEKLKALKIVVNAGNGGVSQQLFTLAATNTLRVFVNVPQMHSRSAAPGVGAQLTLAEFPNRRFVGKIARNAESIDPSTRTLLTEVDVVLRRLIAPK